ncbi:MAG: c-type cytochrome [Pyrinomonadaceae bacterium]
MKKVIKLAVISSFAVSATLAGWAHAAPAAGRSNQSVSPRSLYVQNCARCHGVDGKAQNALGKKLEADDLTASTASTAKIIRTITNGRGDMPSFRKKLTTKQIASLASYVHSL